MKTQITFSSLVNYKISVKSQEHFLVTRTKFPTGCQSTKIWECKSECKSMLNENIKCLKLCANSCMANESIRDRQQREKKDRILRPQTFQELKVKSRKVSCEVYCEKLSIRKRSRISRPGDLAVLLRVKSAVRNSVSISKFSQRSLRVHEQPSQQCRLILLFKLLFLT